MDSEIAQLPRIALDEGMDPAVRELLRSELAKSGKVDVVAGAAEQKALDEMRRRSHSLSFSAQTACELGQQLAANSLLKATFVPAGSSKRLLVQMFSGETGCLNASAGVFWNEDRPDVSVAEAVSELIGNLRTAPDLPGSAKAPKVEARDIGRETADDWQMEGTSGVVVAFETVPPGAVVLWDGQMLCQTTPCSKLVARGTHKVEFHLVSYLPFRESVQVTADTDGIKRELAPDFGWITVRSTPPGLPVTLSGKPWGTTPLEKRQVPSGPHRVLISDSRYVERGREIVLERGRHEIIDLELPAREGGLQIFARDRQGNDLRATVLVDGREVGRTPYAEKVIIGDHRVTVTHSGARWDRQVTIREKEVEKLEAVLAVGPERVSVVRDKPAGSVSKASAPPPSSDRRRVFHLGTSLSEGIVMADGHTARSGVTGTLAMWLKWRWFRWEPLSLGMSLEGAKPVLLGTGTAWDLTRSLYLRNVFLAAFAQGRKYWGLLYGAGYGFSLGAGWSLDMEVDAVAGRRAGEPAGRKGRAAGGFLRDKNLTSIRCHLDTHGGVTRNVTRTNRSESNTSSSGSVPLNSRIRRRIRGQPRPRCSICRRTNMKWAIHSFLERGRPPASTATGVM